MHPGLRPPARLLLWALALFAAGAAPAVAQPYARFAVADSALPGALAAARAEFESAWNALLVSEIRAHAAHADSARELAALARRVAAAEPAVLGSRIAPEALALRRRWNRRQLRTRVEAAVAESLALAARGRREFGTADSLLLAARDAYRGLGERRREAWVLGSLGANALIAGANHEASAYYDAALRARRALGDSLLVGNTLNDLGQTYLQLARPADAWRVLHEAREIRQAQRRWAQLGGTLNFLGLALAALGRPDSALACMGRSVELISVQGDSARTLVGLTNYAAALTDQGRFEAALATSERALAIARTLGATRQEADLENNLGHLERIAGRYGRALEHLERAAAGFAQSGDLARLALAVSRRGAVLLAIGDAERARPVLERALALADSLGDPAIQAQVQNSQALAAHEAGDPTAARRLAERAYQAGLSAADTIAIHDAAAVLGYVAQEGGELEIAERWLARAAIAGEGLRPEVRANDLGALGVVLQLRGRLDEAERRHREALRIAVESGAPNQAMWTLCNLGDLAERRADYPAAFESYGRALAIADTLRTLQSADRQSIKLFASRRFMFEAMIHLLGKRDRLEPDSGYAERAFEWAERARARAFLDLVAASGERSSGAPILGLRESQALLRGENEALLVYSTGDSSTSLWAIRRDRWQRYTLPARPALRARVQALRRTLADPAASTGPSGQRAARALHAALIAPAESLLAGADHLIVAPDGPLALIPFEALLLRDAPPGGPPPRGSYLGERYAVTYTPSASVLRTRAGRSADSVLVAIGNPDFGAAARGEDAAVTAAVEAGAPAPVTLAALPSTAREIEAIRALAGRRRVVTLTGAEASRARALARPELSRAGILHIATHGDVNEAEPERSGLWLAPEEPGLPPTRIEVADIMRLRLDAGLVTLSACETGLGRLENGEGVVGLTRAFMAAGARSVLVSLWPVNDRSTARLMERFYRGAFAGRRSHARALADAKRALLADPETRAPYYWAPFVLVGRSD